MSRASRTPPGPDPFLDIRIGLFVLGAILGLAGMFTRVPVIISFGILCLAIGMILGFISKRRRAAEEAAVADDDDAGDDAADDDAADDDAADDAGDDAAAR